MQINTYLFILNNVKNFVKAALPRKQAYLSFKVRRAYSVEDLEFALKVAQDEDWGLAPGDQECYFAADPKGFFIGELNGKEICSTSLVKYPLIKLAVMGLGITLPEYRRKGYQRLVVKHAVQSVPKDYCIQVDVINNLLPFLQNEIGARSFGWINLSTTVESRKVLDTLKTFTSGSNIFLRPIVEHECEKLCIYEGNITKMYRKSFLSKWINIPGRKGWVAINGEGDITGFAVSRKIYVPRNMYKIAPLYADSPDVARYLLRQISVEIFAENKGNKLYFDVPIGNKFAEQLFKNDLEGKIHWEITRVFTKQPPQVYTDNIYAITCHTVG